MSDTFTMTKSEAVSQVTLSNGDLAQLATRIKTEHDAIVRSGKDILRRALTAGEALLKAKDKVEHGQWLAWLKTNCELSDRTANVYMQLAKGRTAIERALETKSAETADLTITEALKIITPPATETNGTGERGGNTDSGGGNSIGTGTGGGRSKPLSDQIDGLVKRLLEKLGKIEDQESAKATAAGIVRDLAKARYVEVKMK